MTAPTGVELRPITGNDVPLVAHFFHQHLNSRLSAAEWASAMVPPWNSATKDRGFLLAADGIIVGANLLFWSEREIDGRPERFCNLAALCVRPDHRAHTVRLLRAALRPRDVHFTDLSPSGSVVEMNRRLGFEPLDTATALVPSVPRPWPRGTRLVTDPDEVRDLLDGDDRRVFDDHRGARAARHLVVVRGDRHCYLVYRRDRRKRLPVFATLLHVGDPELLVATLPRVLAHVLLHDHALVLLVELRLLGPRRPRLSTTIEGRTKMFKSPRLRADQIDDLYSELTCVAW